MSLQVRIIITDIETNDIIKEHHGVYFSTTNQKWITRMLVWALYNGKTVEILNEDDADRYVNTITD